MITIRDGKFYAPQNAPYAAALKSAGWGLIRGEYTTNDPTRVIPVVQYIDPSLIPAMMANVAKFNQSIAKEASEDFVAIVPEGKKLFGFQEADVEYILSHKDTLLAEDAGLGKSAIMITALNHMKPKRVLIICPAIAKYNWMLKEWPKWNCLADLSIDVAEAQKAWPETDVIIVNYDILERFKKQIDAVEWDVLICDESHRIKNSEAKRTKFVLGGTIKTTKDKATIMGAAPSRRRGFYKVKAIPAGKRIFATATPMNRPKDLWTVCEAFDPKGLGANWDYFHRRYCSMMKTPFGIDINGADNLEELGAKMRTAFMVRHVPSEVIDLPPLREELFVLPPVQLVKKEEEAFVDDNMAALLAFASATGAEVSATDTRAGKTKLLGMVGAAIIGNVSQIGKPEFKPLFTEFAKLREQTGLAKVPSVIEYLSDKIDNDNPIVIFAYHRSVIKLLLEAYPDAAYVMGGMPSRERAEQVSKFEDGKTNVFIGNLDAAGEAITLTRAAYIAFAEQDWRATAMIQARKRIHRITQDRPCLAEHLCAAESCDYYIATTMFGKMAHIQETLGSC